jgi:hypothetical protein
MVTPKVFRFVILTLEPTAASALAPGGAVA